MKPRARRHRHIPNESLFPWHHQRSLRSRPGNTTIKKEQEKARRNIAYWLVWMVAAIIVIAFGYLWTLPLTRGTREYVDNLVLVLQIVFAPIIALAGTVGYYFGANASQR